MGITAWGGMVTGVIWGAGGSGIATCALSSILGADPLFDCRPIGAGEIIEGAAGADGAGLAPFSIGASAGGAGSVDSICCIGGGLPVSSSVIAIWKVVTTIATTLAPTSSERILAVMFEGSLPSAALPLSMAVTLPVVFEFAFAAAFAAFSLAGAAAAACAARRAAAMNSPAPWRPRRFR
jgi:hypothetical protein